MRKLSARAGATSVLSTLMISATLGCTTTSEQGDASLSARDVKLASPDGRSLHITIREDGTWGDPVELAVAEPEQSWLNTEFEILGSTLLVEADTTPLNSVDGEDAEDLNRNYVMVTDDLDHWAKIPGHASLVVTHATDGLVFQVIDDVEPDGQFSGWLWTGDEFERVPVTGLPDTALRLDAIPGQLPTLQAVAMTTDGGCRAVLLRATYGTATFSNFSESEAIDVKPARCLSPGMDPGFGPESDSLRLTFKDRQGADGAIGFTDPFSAEPTPFIETN